MPTPDSRDAGSRRARTSTPRSTCRPTNAPRGWPALRADARSSPPTSRRCSPTCDALSRRRLPRARAAAEPARAALAGADVGAYRWSSPIGHGGMGRVWLARAHRRPLRRPRRGQAAERRARRPQRRGALRARGPHPRAAGAPAHRAPRRRRASRRPASRTWCWSTSTASRSTATATARLAVEARCGCSSTCWRRWRTRTPT